MQTDPAAQTKELLALIDRIKSDKLTAEDFGKLRQLAQNYADRIVERDQSEENRIRHFE